MGKIIKSKPARFLPVIFFLMVFSIPLQARYVNFTNSAIYYPYASSEKTILAAQMLHDEIARRTGIHLPMGTNPESFNTPAIIVGLETEISLLQKEFGSALRELQAAAPEGYKIVMLPGEKTMLIAGHDERGVMYGIGYLLRKMELRNEDIKVPLLSVSSSPMSQIRGHHISYHFTSDSMSQEKSLYEQYLRELIYFGLNHVSVSSPAEAQLALKYGMDISMYMANLGDDFQSTEGIRKELEKREAIFRNMPKLNEIFVPGGDPGDLEPDVLFSWLEKLAPVLLKYHPDARIWVSPQNNNKGKATAEWYQSFFEHVNRDYSWFGGVVFGPWTRVPLEEIREIVNERIPIRRFPDITHLFGCQYPAPELDWVFAHTLSRMSIQPRPEGFKHIHNLYANIVVGARPYSEGNSDDVNKFVWSDQDWNSNTPAIETLRDYARLFIGPDYTESIAQGILALEKNLKGQLIDNDNIEKTLLQWQEMERTAEPEVLQNPRFQLGLIRAYYDAYQKQRLMYENVLEYRAMEALRNAGKLGTLQVIEQATKVLNEASVHPVGGDYKLKINELYNSLFRGASPRWMSEFQKCEFVERIDVPLNNSEWLLSQFDRIKNTSGEPEQLQMVYEILNRTNPGPGGFYDNLGTEASFSRVKAKKKAEEDPGTHFYPRRNYIRGVVPMPVSWKVQMATLYEEPLVLVYENLDPNSEYKIRINYTGGIGRGQSKMKLIANGEYIVHDFIDTEGKPIQEFNLPKEAYSEGKMELSWTCGKGERGAPVAEVWIIKK
ncbi:hypothetical protein SAMN05444274_104217 [Mariniphaga anaerophila]|uniref:Alpha glucuronidase N-terminal domain-containing protein n=1 Tax=Mariniphaga anaerophila TaxID=1484053 RepID=A0A1M5A7C2_9BACT|nr:hypothetical protein [Mariniphaga anaerophila]SHF26211.1 hypothetical protein SAMN05444274_104217 [Mariniphaga anaerophila]